VKIKFNATGTHVNRGLLKVRLDFYPDESDKCYPTFYINQWVREPTDEEMADDAKLALIPTHKVLTPCLCHFITVPENLVVADFTDYILSMLDKDTLASIDGFILRSDSAHLISPLMRNKRRFSTMPVVTKDMADLLASTNDKLKAIVIDFAGGGKVIEIEPESIDIGSPAINGNDYLVSNETHIDSNNPANENGSLDTIEVWSLYGMTGFRAGTFYLVSGTTYKCRDSETIGNVTGYSKQTFTGLTINAVANDRMGSYQGTGFLECDTEAANDLFWASGEHIDPDDEATYNNTGTYAMSIYGTGGGGVTAKTSAETGAGAEGSVLRAAMQRAETASGADARQSLLASLTRNENGTGVEQSLLTSLVARLVAETGSGIETRSLVARLLSSDAGHGVDTGVIPGLKSIFGNDGGIGYDALKALIGTSGAVSDMKLPGRQGQVKIPSKGVSL